MASIHKDIPIDADPDDVWAAVRDFGNVHSGWRRASCSTRGSTARRASSPSPTARSRASYWSIATRRGGGWSMPISERVKHYSASVQVLADGDTSRLIWIVDVLPNDIAPYISGQMDQAALAMQKTLGRHAA